MVRAIRRRGAAPSEGAALAQSIGRPYLEVACRAHQGFASKTVSLATARERGRQAVALAERFGLGDRPILAPALGSIGCIAVWMGEFDEAERWLRRAWEVAAPQINPAAAVLLHASTGMLHAARGQHQSALQQFVAAVRAQSLLTGVHALGPPIAGWLAATQARLGMPDEARATLTGFSAEDEVLGGIRTARAVICIAEGDPSTALDLLNDVREAPPLVGLPAFALVEAHLLAGLAYLDLGDRNAAAAAAEAALAAAEPDRLIFPFAMTGSGELLDALPRHQTAHGALLADIADVLRGAPAPSAEGELLSPTEELSPSELRVLRYLPTNLTRPEIARELYVSINTVNSHIRSIYSKLAARDRSSAVRRARQLRLLSTAPLEIAEGARSPFARSARPDRSARRRIARTAPDPGASLPHTHLILAMRPRPVSSDDGCVDQGPDVYLLRISGHLGQTALSAFPSMVAQLKGGDTLLTGVLDRSALYGVLAEIEALNLDLIELRRLVPRCT
jgi:LuxR family maltose regulon positive regulatory protein